MIEYKPKLRVMPPRLINVPTAWAEVTPIIADILIEFEVPRNNMLEFGVDYGYSTAVFANYFKNVVGVDHFMGDINAGDRGDGIYDQVVENLKDFPNIKLAPFDYRDWTVAHDHLKFDLIHVDIVHNYERTFECGDWAIRHAPVVLFHDTLAFREVMQAVTNLAQLHNAEFYNVNERHGVGIVVRR